MPFEVRLTQAEGGAYGATIHNGEEVLAFDSVTLAADGTVSFSIEHYQSVFKGDLNQAGNRIEGEWTKVTGADKMARLPFFAEYDRNIRFETKAQAQVQVGGLWTVTFDNNEDEPQPAVGEFKQDGSKVTGTFMTPTGDYRFLEGSVDGRTLSLSCFDGGHAFLFKAQLGVDDRLTGDFWSRDSWHETWSAVRDAEAALPDPYSLTKLKEGLQEFRFRFPDLDGEMVAHDDPSFQGKVRVISIFGSWCPNCNDEAPFLQELYDRYGDRGLEVIGLAFEMTGDPARDRKVLRRFSKRHGTNYRILLAGGSTDKKKAAEVLPDLNHLLSYPTTILVNREGKVVSIHTGFTGPGTSKYETLKNTYLEKIEGLL